MGSASTQDKEKQIIELFVQDESSAMDKLYNEYADKLFGVCRRYLTDYDSAQDALQDCLIKIFTQFKSFEYRGQGSLWAWLNRIAINESLLFLRKEKTSAFIRTGNELPDTCDDEPPVNDIPIETIAELIRNLPKGYRTVFNLFALDGYSHKEIAQMLGIKEYTSASQYFKARNMLARMIKQYRQKQQQ